MYVVPILASKAHIQRYRIIVVHGLSYQVLILSEDRVHCVLLAYGRYARPLSVGLERKRSAYVLVQQGGFLGKDNHVPWRRFGEMG